MIAPAATDKTTNGRTGMVRLLRPRQWVKNVLVFAAPGAAGVLHEPGVLADTVLAFVAFSLAASGTYCLNDAADAEADRAHPTKRHRPVADGSVSVTTARLLGVALLVASIAVASTVGGWRLPLVLLVYVALTTTYTVWLKHIAVVDLAAVAAGFVLRAIAGAVASDVEVSDWFLIVASFGSLFMVVGKRRAESDELGVDAAATRTTLGLYSRDYLIQLQTISSAVVMVGYCLWAFEKAALTDSSIPWFQLSIVPFVIILLRYALLVEVEDHRGPEEIILGDRQLQVLGLLWAAVFACGVYLGNAPPLTS